MATPNTTNPNPTVSSESMLNYLWFFPGKTSKLVFDFKIPLLSCFVLYIPTVTLIERYFVTAYTAKKVKVVDFIWNCFLCIISALGAAVMLIDYWSEIAATNPVHKAGTKVVMTLFCFIKVLEFGDSIILALKKQPVTFSHRFHHLTVAFYTWHSLALNACFIRGFIIFNLISDALKYGYQAASSIFHNSRLLRTIEPCVVLSGILQLIGSGVICALAMYDGTITTELWWNAQIGTILFISNFFFVYAQFLEQYFPGLRPAMVAFLTLFHFFGVVGLIKIFNHPRAPRLIAEAVFLYIIGGFGVTCGAHRLWSHRSYKANFPFRFFLMICNSIANQGSIYHWSRDHRVHHKHSETEKDPHNSNRGFFYSHVGWLLLKKDDAVRKAGRELDFSDLLEDSCVRFQRRYDPYFQQFMCFVLPSIYGYYVYNDYWLGFFVHGVLRWLICLHATWTVNSVAHFWGARPYNPNIKPSESWFTALVANGEGWHNWHHVFPYDYATSEAGILEQYNPSKLVIDIAAYFGAVWGRKRATQQWEEHKKHMVLTGEIAKMTEYPSENNTSNFYSDTEKSKQRGSRLPRRNGASQDSLSGLSTSDSGENLVGLNRQEQATVWFQPTNLRH